jgi:hypothetical protein
MNEAHDEHEEWQPVRDRYGQNAKYDVSTLGRVRSQHPGFEGRILKNGEGPDSRSTDIRRVWILDVYKGPSTPVRVDQLVARTFLGEPKDGAYRVIHKNGCKWDDRAENLEWAGAVDRAAPSEPVRAAPPSVQQARSREKAAKERLQQALEEFGDAVEARVRAEALEEAQTGVQGAADGLG